MAEIKPEEQKISYKVKPGDKTFEGEHGQLIRMSYSNFTDKGYLDITITRTDSKQDVQPAKVRIYLGGNENIDKLFGLAGKGVNNSSAPALYLEAENIKIVSSKNKGRVEHVIYGDSLVTWLTELVDTLISHNHPMEAVSINQLSKWNKLKNQLKTIVSKGVSIG